MNTDPNTHSAALYVKSLGRPEVIAVQEQVVAAANGERVIVPDAGHYIHLDRPDLVIKTIRDVAGRI